MNTLSDSWKTYLKTIGRYDQDSDSYNLTGLIPARDDPYGTSSMSVQISRNGTHVSIKNRYNHTVSNPDNTLDSNLDNVAYGLRQAVFSLVGREDLMDKTEVALAKGYIADNNGGIHAYKYEENNVYYGEYEYISNGVVSTIDRGKYYMISPQIYVPISQEGDEIRLGYRKFDYEIKDSLFVELRQQYDKREYIRWLGLSMVNVDRDIRILHESSKIEGKEKDSHLVKLRQEYAKRDYDNKRKVAIEYLRESFEFSYKGYNEIAEHIRWREPASIEQSLLKRGSQEANDSLLTKEEFGELFEAKMLEWQESGVLDYVVERIITHGELHTLVARPNVTVSAKSLISLANIFAKNLGYDAIIDDGKRSIFEEPRTDEELAQLSGFNPDEGAVIFSLIPNKYNADLGYDTVERQVQILDSLKRQSPNLKYKVPSVLDALTFWQTLKATGQFNGPDIDERSKIRHFNLILSPGRPRVPYSHFYGCTRIRGLSISYVECADYARLSVG